MALVPVGSAASPMGSASSRRGKALLDVPLLQRSPTQYINSLERVSQIPTEPDDASSGEEYRADEQKVLSKGTLVGRARLADPTSFQANSLRIPRTFNDHFLATEQAVGEDGQKDDPLRQRAIEREAVLLRGLPNKNTLLAQRGAMKREGGWPEVDPVRGRGGTVEEILGSQRGTTALSDLMLTMFPRTKIRRVEPSPMDLAKEKEQLRARRAERTARDNEERMRLECMKDALRARIAAENRSSVRSADRTDGEVERRSVHGLKGQAVFTPVSLASMKSSPPPAAAPYALPVRKLEFDISDEEGSVTTTQHLLFSPSVTSIPTPAPRTLPTPRRASSPSSPTPPSDTGRVLHTVSLPKPDLLPSVRPQSAPIHAHPQKTTEPKAGAKGEEEEQQQQQQRIQYNPEGYSHRYRLPPTAIPGTWKPSTTTAEPPASLPPPRLSHPERVEQSVAIISLGKEGLRLSEMDKKPRISCEESMQAEEGSAGDEMTDCDPNAWTPMHSSPSSAFGSISVDVKVVRKPRDVVPLVRASVGGALAVLHCCVPAQPPPEPLQHREETSSGKCSMWCFTGPNVFTPPTDSIRPSSAGFKGSARKTAKVEGPQAMADMVARMISSSSCATAVQHKETTTETKTCSSEADPPNPVMQRPASAGSRPFAPLPFYSRRTTVPLSSTKEDQPRALPPEESPAQPLMTLPSPITVSNDPFSPLLTTYGSNSIYDTPMNTPPPFSLGPDPPKATQPPRSPVLVSPGEDHLEGWDGEGWDTVGPSLLDVTQTNREGEGEAEAEGGPERSSKSFEETKKRRKKPGEATGKRRRRPRGAKDVDETGVKESTVDDKAGQESDIDHPGDTAVEVEQAASREKADGADAPEQGNKTEQDLQPRGTEDGCAPNALADEGEDSAPEVSESEPIFSSLSPPVALRLKNIIPNFIITVSSTMPSKPPSSGEGPPLPPSRPMSPDSDTASRLDVTQETTASSLSTEAMKDTTGDIVDLLQTHVLFGSSTTVRVLRILPTAALAVAAVGAVPLPATPLSPIDKVLLLSSAVSAMKPRQSVSVAPAPPPQWPTPARPAASAKRQIDDSKKRGTLCAVVAAVGAYKDSRLVALHQVIEDAQRIAGVLRAARYKVVELHDAADKPCTAPSLVAAVTSARKAAPRAEDVCLVVFLGLGHFSNTIAPGVQHGGGQAQLHMFTREFDVGWKGSGKPPGVVTISQLCDQSGELKDLRSPVLLCDTMSCFAGLRRPPSRSEDATGYVYVGGRTSVGGSLTAHYHRRHQFLASFYFNMALFGHGSRDQRVSTNSLNVYLEKKLKKRGIEVTTNASNLHMGDVILIERFEIQRDPRSAKELKHQLKSQMCKISLGAFVLRQRHDVQASAFTRVVAKALGRLCTKAAQPGRRMSLDKTAVEASTSHKSVEAASPAALASTAPAPSSVQKLRGHTSVTELVSQKLRTTTPELVLLPSIRQVYPYRVLVLELPGNTEAFLHDMRKMLSCKEKVEGHLRDMAGADITSSFYLNIGRFVAYVHLPEQLAFERLLQGLEKKEATVETVVKEEQEQASPAKAVGLTNFRPNPASVFTPIDLPLSLGFSDTLSTPTTTRQRSRSTLTSPTLSPHGPEPTRGSSFNRPKKESARKKKESTGSQPRITVGGVKISNVWEYIDIVFEGSEWHYRKLDRAIRSGELHDILVGISLRRVSLNPDVIFAETAATKIQTLYRGQRMRRRWLLHRSLYSEEEKGRKAIIAERDHFIDTECKVVTQAARDTVEQQEEQMRHDKEVWEWEEWVLLIKKAARGLCKIAEIGHGRIREEEEKHAESLHETAGRLRVLGEYLGWRRLINRIHKTWRECMAGRDRIERDGLFAFKKFSWDSMPLGRTWVLKERGSVPCDALISVVVAAGHLVLSAQVRRASRCSSIDLMTPSAPTVTGKTGMSYAALETTMMETTVFTDRDFEDEDHYQQTISNMFPVWDDDGDE
eukprot:Sspe_Gene.8642::Locus_2926_Transcript_2_3_Confidence_0.333_Length_6010::g.8642::m.8642